MLLKAVEMAFREDHNVLFDMEPNPQKYKQFGNVLVGWTHGDMPDKKHDKLATSDCTERIRTNQILRGSRRTLPHRKPKSATLKSKTTIKPSRITA